MSAAFSRLSLPAEEEWTDAQREASAAIRSGPRGALFGPFVTLLHAPELMTRVQRVGEYLRFSSAVSNDLFELAILTVARHWHQEFEWDYHCPFAVAAGVPVEVVRDIAEHRRPSSGRAEFGFVWEFVDSLLAQGNVTTPVFDAVASLGEQIVVELVSTVGYYTMLALTMNVAGTAPTGRPDHLPGMVP
ncbi:carboxymuconolactone decarboxylase family protein [Microbacterium sp. RD1]|uniref:carboxymuconolactone decarboxylase family protein n=1 Tax=Microbacterium sp. RD1 TaxID=3457313 RepID=UPI003FA5F425